MVTARDVPMKRDADAACDRHQLFARIQLKLGNHPTATASERQKLATELLKDIHKLEQLKTDIIKKLRYRRESARLTSLIRQWRIQRGGQGAMAPLEAQIR